MFYCLQPQNSLFFVIFAQIITTFAKSKKTVHLRPLLLYIHGLNSDANSRKLSLLKSYFGDRVDYHCIEWGDRTNLRFYFDKKRNEWLHYQKLIIVGDSTGANFAYQLREQLRDSHHQIALVLLSPFMCTSQQIVRIRFPFYIIPQIWYINKPTRALIIASPTDEVLTQNWLFEKDFKEVKVIEVSDEHSLRDFEEYIPHIDEYINDLFSNP